MKTLAGRANVTVAVCVVAEFILAKQARLDRGTSLWTGHVGRDPGLLAGLDVLDLEVTLVGHGIDRRDTKDILRRLRSPRQQTHVDDLVGDLLFHEDRKSTRLNS